LAIRTGSLEQRQSEISPGVSLSEVESLTRATSEELSRRLESLGQQLEALQLERASTQPGPSLSDVDELTSKKNDALARRMEALIVQKLDAWELNRADAQPSSFQSEIEALDARIAALQTAIEGSTRQQASLVANERARYEELILDLEARLETAISNRAQDFSGQEFIQHQLSVVADLKSEMSQLKTQLSLYAEQKQFSKLMEHLSDLQTRSARQADQIKEFEHDIQRGGQEQQLQLQNQLDMQERQRILLEQLQSDLAGLQAEVAKQHAIVDQQQEAVVRLSEQADQAAKGAELRRRASDQPIQDSSMQPLIESALHIERGEYAEAVRCLEAAQQLSDNPKLEQALQLARKMMQHPPLSEPAPTAR
jgi:hypothetical protein